MRKVIIDTDCGVDDATAIILAILSKKVEIVAITCVVGNTTLKNVINNVGRVLEITGKKDIPIYAGSEYNLMHNKVATWEGHGNDGFGDINIKNSDIKLASDRHASIEMIDIINKYGNCIDIITLGPLTNIAVAISLEPTIFNKVGNIFMMIGSETCNGNSSILGEFNCDYDPESAKIVFSVLSNITICSWDLTLNNFINWSIFDKIKNANEIGKIIADTFGIYEKLFRLNGFNNNINYMGWSVPDPLCIMCYLYPELIVKSKFLYTSICVSGEGRGATMIDHFNSFKISNLQRWITEIDHNKLEQLFLDLLT